MWLRFLYPTPKLEVRAVVLREGKLLLVREATDGRWSLPGGCIDLGGSLSRAAEREVLEESGYEVNAVKLFQSQTLIIGRTRGRRGSTSFD
jgi:ADP-ribose pyrophosphatase YjhB (NUDIX family)